MYLQKRIVVESLWVSPTDPNPGVNMRTCKQYLKKKKQHKSMWSSGPRQTTRCSLPTHFPY